MPIITCGYCGHKTTDLKVAEKHYKKHRIENLVKEINKDWKLKKKK
jgi:hypothetical protein